MSLTAFATLLAKHPAEADAIAHVESVVVQMVRRNPAVAIDERLLEVRTDVDVTHLEQYLVELVVAGALEERFALACDRGGGIAAEAETLSLLPEDVECAQCGESHHYDSRRVSVFFVASETFKHAVLTT